MRKSPAMHKLHRLANIPDHDLGFGLGVSLFVIEPLAEIPPFFEFHDHEVTSIFFEVVDHGADVSVVEAGHDENFFEYGGVDGGFDFFAEDTFDCDLAASGAVDSAAYGGEGSTFELLSFGVMV